jgi:hypothetical protein
LPNIVPMPSAPAKCASCGADPMVPKVDDGSCSACGVDPFLVEVVGEKKALAAALESHSHDLHRFVAELAAMLETGFAEHTEIKKSGLFSKHVSEIRVTLDHHVYRLVVNGKKATAHRSRNVRGIKLKEDLLALPEFLEQLSNDLTRVASESRAAQAALAKFVGK